MIKDRIILGIDPGTIVMGYGILRVENNKPHLEAMGVLQLNKYENHYLVCLNWDAHKEWPWPPPWNATSPFSNMPR